MTDFLVDTNLLVRRVQPGSPQRSIARRALHTLVGRGDELYLTAQNLHEFWYVATRSAARNGLGLSPERAARKLAALKSAFRFLPETLDTYPRWENLVVALGIGDAPAYDARLVAVMQVYGIAHILTFNTADFARFSGITAVDPATL
jgi:predicted nucleic acid-binding protein